MGTRNRRRKGRSSRFPEEVPTGAHRGFLTGGGFLNRRARYDEKLVGILECACQIFADKGYHHASVRDVAAATGLSPAGLYYYFRTKEELLFLIMQTCLVSLLERIRARTSRVDDPALRIRIIARTHLAHVERRGKQMRVLVREWESLEGDFRAEIRRHMRSYLNLVIRALKEISPQKRPAELRAAAFALFGMLTWVDQWYHPDRDLPMDLLADSFSGILLEGFRTGTFTPSRSAHTGEAERLLTAAWSRKSAASSILAGPGF